MIFNWNVFVTLLIVCSLAIGIVAMTNFIIVAFEKHWAVGFASLMGAVLIVATIAGTVAGLF